MQINLPSQSCIKRQSAGRHTDPRTLSQTLTETRRHGDRGGESHVLMLLVNFVVLHLLLSLIQWNAKREQQERAGWRKSVNECKLKKKKTGMRVCVFWGDVTVREGWRFLLKMVYCLWVSVDYVCQFWAVVARGKREPVFLQ